MAGAVGVLALSARYAEPPRARARAPPTLTARPRPRADTARGAALVQRAAALVARAPPRRLPLVLAPPARPACGPRSTRRAAPSRSSSTPRDAAHRVAHDFAHELGHAWDSSGTSTTRPRAAPTSARRGVPAARWWPSAGARPTTRRVRGISPRCSRAVTPPARSSAAGSRRAPADACARCLPARGRAGEARRDRASARCVAFVVAAVLLAAGSLGGADGAAAGDPHAGVGDGRRSRSPACCEAAEAASTDRSQAELAAEGRRLFARPRMAKTGESCAELPHRRRRHERRRGHDPPSPARGRLQRARATSRRCGASRDTPPYGWAGAGGPRRPSWRARSRRTSRTGRRQPVEETARAGRRARGLPADPQATRDPASTRARCRPPRGVARRSSRARAAASTATSGPSLTDAWCTTARSEGRRRRQRPGRRADRSAPPAPSTRRACATCATRRRICTTATSRPWKRWSTSTTASSVLSPLASRTAELADLVAYLESL